MDHNEILRVLIVQDTPDRQKMLKQLYRHHAWILVHTAARAIRLVHVYEFDYISLEFNLAGEVRGDEVADIHEGMNVSARVSIHSMNPQGCEQIYALLLKR